MGLFALPYFTFGPWPKEPFFQLGNFPIQIQPFGLLVAMGIFWNLHMGAKKAETKLGLSGEKYQSVAFYALFFGWIISHIIDVLFYHFESFIQNPAIIFRFGGTFSSYGGLVGGIIGVAFWLRKYKEKDLLKWFDLAVWSLPFGWFFGRMGCSIVHDHPGLAAPHWFLAINFADPTRNWLDGPRHDLGFYEFLWWGIILIVWYFLDKKPRPKGFYIAMLPLLYTPIRFVLDFLRIPESQNGDSRYFGLTPGQYFSLLFFLVGLYYLKRLKNVEPEPWVAYQEPKKLKKHKK
jgi:phosphatidylglycerol---prolipoprotein diacylglyceryl transferase